MDRFKFRVWREEEKRFVESDCGSPLVISQDGILCDSYDYLDYDGFGIVEQCTGLKDKNGKLIYEGDWLKTKDGYYCYVVWFDGFWWVKSLPSEAMDLEHVEFYKECEVIGNIHENADLLGEE